MNRGRRLLEWIDDRTGWLSALERFLNKKVPPRLPWSYTLGSLALLLFAVQAVTGVFLAIYYAPTPDHAYDSLRYLESAIAGGRFLRGLHHWGASFLVVAAVLHLLRVFRFGSYRKPREMNWLIGVKLLLFVMAFGLTGYLLPWDQKAWWATQVTLHIAGSLPLAGPFLARVVAGGPELGALTLNRFFAVHVLILPAAALLGIVLHLMLVQRHGSSGPHTYRGDPASDGETFHPRQTARDATAMAVVFILLVLLAVWRGAPLEAVADPTDTGYVPRPEWYFLGLFQLLKYFPGPLEIVGTVILPGLVTLLLVALPWIDRAGDRSDATRRPVLLLGFALFAAGVALTAAGAFDRRGARVPAWRQEQRTPFFAVAGPALAAERNCADCHREDGFGAGPALVGQPWSRTASWIRGHLSDPEFVAPGAREADEPIGGSGQAILLAWLELLKEGPIPPPAPADTAAIALISGNGCANCHRIDGVGGRMGPDLAGVGSRRSVGWIVDYLPDPQAVNPDARMKAYPDLTVTERRTIAAYLARLY